MPADNPIPNNPDIPQKINIFYREESHFLPEGKTFETLTAKEREELRNKYRFDQYRVDKTHDN